MSNRIEAMVAGWNAAKEGKSINEATECSPYLDQTMSYEWETGYYYHSPSARTPIQDVLAPYFGGPLQRREIMKRCSAKEATRQVYVTGKVHYEKCVGYEEIPLPFFKPENYVVREDSKYSSKKKGDASDHNWVFNDHILRDGVYDASGLPFVYLENAETMEGSITKEGLAFVKQHGSNIYIAAGYQVEGIFLFAGKPKKWGGTIGEFGRGACAMFQDAPKSLLIIAEDD